MTTLAPETIPPAPVAVKAKKPRSSWTQAEVADLVKRFVSGEELSGAECTKLEDLGMMEKPAKPTLTNAVKVQADHAVSYFEDMPKEQKALAIRYAIKALSALLPKRAPK